MLQVLYSNVDGTVCKSFYDEFEVLHYIIDLKIPNNKLITIADLKTRDTIAGTRSVLLRALQGEGLLNAFDA